MSSVGQLVADSEGPPIPPGIITLITGCMFSGKTTELLRRIDGTESGHALLFKHVIDTRYAIDAVVSHGGKSCAAIVVDGSAAMLHRIPDDVSLVGVDEAHFLDDGIVAVVNGLRSSGIDVVLTSLNCDSWGNPFAVVDHLTQIADARIVLAASCASCGDAADRTQRTTPIVDGNMIGGAESYEPRCLRCWRPPETFHNTLSIDPSCLF